MYSKTFALLTLATLVAAQNIQEDGKAVISAAEALKSQVDVWQKSDSLLGALAIQNLYPPLSTAVVAFEKALDDVTEADLTSENVGLVQNLADTVVGLLGALNEKANDIIAVGAIEIVQKDIEELGDPAANIVRKLLSAAGTRCDLVSSLKPAGDQLASAFTEAAGSYSAPAPVFPEITCEGGATSAAESSPAQSSPAQSSPAQSSPAQSSPAQSSPAQSSPAQSPSHSDDKPGPVAGAAVVGGGLGGLAAFAALLL